MYHDLISIQATTRIWFSLHLLLVGLLIGLLIWVIGLSLLKLVLELSLLLIEALIWIGLLVTILTTLHHSWSEWLLLLVSICHLLSCISIWITRKGISLIIHCSIRSHMFSFWYWSLSLDQWSQTCIKVTGGIFRLCWQ